MPFSRRAFLKGSAILPFAVWLEQHAWAQPAVRTRYDATSTRGKAMLRIYARGVQRMKSAAIVTANPRSWTFQWYTHQVKTVGPGGANNWPANASANKTQEITRVYPPGSNTIWKALATDMWNTCQSHLGQPEDYFLPWHRMYVRYLEEIIRALTGEPTFTLPYWDYSISGPNHGVLPREFRLPSDPLFRVLYVARRNPGVNNGVPIDEDDPGALDLDALAQCRYSRQSSTVQGFNATLDFGLHGNVHVLTGNPDNMGFVPTAAFDPIFYLHHCNIDRLWAAWNRAGRLNPSGAPFIGKTFTFVNGAGTRVTPNIGSVLDIASLGYTYQTWPVVPTCPPQLASPQAAEPITVVSTTAMELTAAPAKRRLSSPGGAQATVDLGTRIERLQPTRRLYVVIRDLKADIQPGVIYHVYLEVAAGATTPKSEHWIGSINFFDAGDHGAHHAPADESGLAPKEKAYSFDITDLAKRLHAGGALRAEAEITIAPARTPAADAKPLVGEVSIVVH
jgi:tyrosinase